LRFFARKTPAHGSHINAAAKIVFIDSTAFPKPFEEGFTGGPGKRPLHDRFFITGGLTDQHHRTMDGMTGDRRRLHLRTQTTGVHGAQMPLQLAG
jgi:hypothetical protein